MSVICVNSPLESLFREVASARRGIRRTRVRSSLKDKRERLYISDPEERSAPLCIAADVRNLGPPRCGLDRTSAISGQCARTDVQMGSGERGPAYGNIYTRKDKVAHEQSIVSWAARGWLRRTQTPRAEQKHLSGRRTGRGRASPHTRAGSHNILDNPKVHLRKTQCYKSGIARCGTHGGESRTLASSLNMNTTGTWMQVSSIQPVGQTSLRVVDRRSGHLHVKGTIRKSDLECDWNVRKRSSKGTTTRARAKCCARCEEWLL